MDQPKDETQLLTCENCLKEMDENKLDLHIGYCRRNVKKCPECEMMYDVNYAEEHEEEYHKKCEHCKKIFLPMEIEKHKKECGPRLIYCAFCELNVPELLYLRHVDQCGSRTVTCDICQKLIPIKDSKQHEEECLLRLCGEEENKKKEQEGDEELNKYEQGRKRVKTDVDAKPRSVAVDIFKNPIKKPASKQKIAQNQEELKVEPKVSGGTSKATKTKKEKEKFVFIDDESSEIKAVKKGNERDKKFKHDF